MEDSDFGKGPFINDVTQVGEGEGLGCGSLSLPLWSLAGVLPWWKGVERVIGVKPVQQEQFPLRDSLS